MRYINNENKTQYSSGIYCIESDCGKKYIGSAIKIKMRYGVHIHTLKNIKHDNPRLQNYFNKYGSESLRFYTIELCEKDKLIEREQYYIDTLNPFFNVLRIAGNTSGNKPWLGKKHSEETKAKMSKSLREYFDSKPKKEKPVKLTREQNIERWAQMNKTPEARKRNSELHKGKQYFLGKKHTDEYKAARCGAGNGRARAVKCIELNMIFETGREACKYFGVSRSAVGTAMRRNGKIAGKYTIVYADN